MTVLAHSKLHAKHLTAAHSYNTFFNAVYAQAWVSDYFNFYSCLFFIHHQRMRVSKEVKVTDDSVTHKNNTKKTNPKQLND